MIAYLTIVKYPKYFGWAGLLSMAVFRLPLLLHKRISFYKLLGCGKNGTFDTRPEWRQWALLTVVKKVHSMEYTHWMTNKDGVLENDPTKDAEMLHQLNEKYSLVNNRPDFVNAWWQFFHCKVYTLVLDPIEGHGTWEYKACFGTLPKNSTYDGEIAVLTRATIRLSKLKSFWKSVPAVANQMANAKGLKTSVGIGEIPLIKQATFSVWEDKTAMKNFAYSMQEHKQVVQNTHKEKWYSEEMFVRFRILASEVEDLSK